MCVLVRPVSSAQSCGSLRFVCRLVLDAVYTAFFTCILFIVQCCVADTVVDLWPIHQNTCFHILLSLRCSLFLTCSNLLSVEAHFAVVTI